MVRKKYYLSVDLKIDGNKTTVVLAANDLIALQKYTAFCVGPEELLKFMPNDNDFSVRSFLDDYIKPINKDSYDPFSIRTSPSNKSKNIRIVYKKDADVLLAGKRALTDRIEESLNININDCVSGNMDDNKKEVLMRLYEKFGGRNLAIAIDDVMISKLNMDGFYDKRYEVAARNRWMFIGLSSRCAKALVEDAFKDDRKRIELAFLLKDNTGDLLPSMSSYKKSEAIDKLSEVLPKKSSSHYIRSSIKENILKLSLELKKQDNENTKTLESTSITEEQIIAYNKNRLLEGKKDDLLEMIIHISEKIESLKCTLEILISEKDKLGKLLKQGSFSEDYYSIVSKLETKEEQIKLEKKKLSALEYELYELESGNPSFSDAGFLIEETDKKM